MGIIPIQSHCSTYRRVRLSPPKPEIISPLSIKRLKTRKNLSTLANLFLAWSEVPFPSASRAATEIIPLSIVAFLASFNMGAYLSESREDRGIAVRIGLI